VPVLDADRDRPPRRQLPLADLEKALRVSHGTPP
jgi:hypothetical protein